MSEPPPAYIAGTTPPVWTQTIPDAASDPYILAVAHAAEEALPELETVIRLFSGPFLAALRPASLHHAAPQLTLF